MQAVEQCQMLLVNIWMGTKCLHYGSIQSMEPAERKKITTTMNGQTKNNIKIGARVSIVEKHNQRTGELTDGYVADILTNSPSHPHGIKVRLESGEVGRVQVIH